ncbi:helix-turn-helix domain-containing protein [Streptomyces aidingensis]|uniref:Helix-turn-helix domain-containing protein n=1 Tax=Streptomyces aidingensis TaxID=910347 RepID=A0A1I1FMZ1_9ACTN|nr:helix-turn-helix transcriptional regulator [Streptomyces aidingensis]SFC00685.1 Helix-turn-helix domain-containing protein [Streptomyces aidingensis]
MSEQSFAELSARMLAENGYSLRAAARAVHYDVAYLSRVLRGKQRPSRKLAEALDRLVGAQGALLATVPGEEEQERLARSAARPSQVDAATVEALARVLAAYRRLDDTARPESLIPAVMAQMREVVAMLKEARGRHRAQLAAVASEFVQFAGWLQAQTRQDARAVALLNQALAIADEISNGLLAAQALNFRGYIARQQECPQGVARWFSAAAFTPGTHPAQRLADMLQAAAGMAAMGETANALRLVDQAELLSDAAATVPLPEAAYWLTPAFNRLNMGLCTLELGRPDEAVEHFEAGLAGLPAEQRGAAWTEEHKAALAQARRAL